MEPTEAAVQRARQVRERSEVLDQRTEELVRETDQLLDAIGQHTGRVARGGQSPALADPYPDEPT